MYEDGKGIPQDFVQAYFWYNLAAADNPIEILGEHARDKAAKRRDHMAARLSPTQLLRTQALTRTWQPRFELVRRVQQRLQVYGFSPGIIDGTKGPQLQEALRRFQSSKGWPPTGELNGETLDALGVQQC